MGEGGTRPPAVTLATPHAAGPISSPSTRMCIESSAPRRTPRRFPTYGLGGGAGFKGWWDPPRPPLGPTNPLLPLPRVRRAHQTPRTPPTKRHSGLPYPPSVTPRTPKDALDPSKDPPGPPQPTSMTPPPTIRCQDPPLTLPPISPGTPVAPPSPPITSPTSP